MNNHKSNFIISIITVCYNAEATIEATVKSVIAQKFDNYQYIIIDGNSKDQTVDLIKKHERHIDYWISETDSGIYSAMNKGLKYASGQYIYFLNSGDKFVNEDVLSNFNIIAKENPVDIICGKVLVTADTEHKNIIDIYPRYQVHTQDFRQLFNSAFCHQALFVSTKALMRVGGFDKRFPVFSDFYTVSKIMKFTGNPTYVDLDVTYFNLEGVSSNWKNVRKLELEKKEIFKALGENKSSFFYFLQSIKVEIFILKKKILHACFNR